MSQPVYPVSIKGVVVRDDRVLLLKNERDEWELPGRRIEPGETVGLGLSTEDGVTLNRRVQKEGTSHWQSITPVRYIIRSPELTVASTFQESKGAVLGEYWGGLVFSKVPAGSRKYRA
jgi:hypothetical protein